MEQVFEWLKKISSKEGFFLIVVLSGMAYYIFKFVQTPIFPVWEFGGVSAVICFFTLCLVADFAISSKESADRMKVLASLSLTIIYLACMGMLYVLFIAENPIAGQTFAFALVLSSLVYVIVLFLEHIIFFQGDEYKKEKPNGPFCVAVGNVDDADDSIPEPAEKLPYVYYDKPIEQMAHTIRYYSPYLGKEREIPFRPRKKRGKPFDNVRGIVVADGLVLLRSILFSSNFPDDIREMAKQYEGRLPDKAEIEQIYAKFNEINQNLYECGEPLLKRWKYLYTSGDQNADKVTNYCLNFATGQTTFADCDSFVGAVLVEKSVPDIQQLEADIAAFRRKHLNKTELGDEFDVLCEVDDKKVRLPFSKRHLGKPIGIFPFKNEPEYLELDEVENKKHTDKDVDESRLLDERFCCDCVSKVADRLNLYLKEMHKPVLEGNYLADSSYMRGCGWIIGFDNTSDYYGGNMPAKLRYMGRFYGNCQK